MINIQDREIVGNIYQNKVKNKFHKLQHFV